MVWRKKLGGQSGRTATTTAARTVEPSFTVVPVPPAERPDDGILASVTADLASADSGVEFVYRSIDRLQARSSAEDVLVILDEPPLGRQAFRAGRKPIESSWARELVRNGPPGVHAIPNEIDAAVAASVLQLCSLALRLDVARHDSLHDPLTGLLNRRAFDEHLAASCAQAERYGWSFGVVLLDLDGFKVVNDRLGHAAGDATLRAVGAELRHNLRIGDAAARVGGDEFALVLPNIRDASLREIIERIEVAVEEAVPDARVTLTAGHATAPDDGLDADELYRVADFRLYEGKRRR